MDGKNSPRRGSRVRSVDVIGAEWGIQWFERPGTGLALIKSFVLAATLAERPIFGLFGNPALLVSYLTIRSYLILVRAF